MFIKVNYPEKIIPTTPHKKTVDEDKVVKKESSDEKEFPFWIVILVIVLVIALLYSLIFFLCRKKTKIIEREDTEIESMKGDSLCYNIPK